VDDKNPLTLLKSVREELQTVQRQVDYLVAVLDSQAKAGLDGIAGRVEEDKPLNLDLINHALQQMAGKQSQEEILEVLLSSASKCADRAILFDVEDEKIQAWKGLGITVDLSEVSSTDVNDPLFVAVQSRGMVSGHARFETTLPWLRKLGAPPAKCLCVPLAFGTFVPLVLYADSTTDLDIGSLELLVRLAVLQMQNQYLAHLVQESRQRDAESSRREQSQQRVGVSQEGAGGDWKEADLLARNETAGEDTLESAGLTAQEEEAAHAEARRLARLLVAEIKLYNEDEVVEGRQRSDLYRRLRTDIERSRKMYEKLVHPLIKSQADYYGAEVIRVLARDDADLMGSEYEGTGLTNPIDQGSD